MRSDPSAASQTALDDERKQVVQIAEETADGGTDTHDLAEAIAWELEAGGSVSQVGFRTAVVCERVYDNVEES